MSTPPPATPWAGGQDQEYTTGSPHTLADAAGLQLADAAGATLVDSGVIETPVPETTWTEDDTE